MNYGFNSIMYFIWLMTQITFFHFPINFLIYFSYAKVRFKKIHEKKFIVSLYNCTLQILMQSSGFDECDYFNCRIKFFLGNLNI